MATSNGALREVLQFENGLDYEVALKYGTGKPVSNGRIMFTTTADEVFFLDAFDADRIAALELKPQEKFRMRKQGTGRNAQIEAFRIKVERPVDEPAAPPAPPRTAESLEQIPRYPQGNTLSKMMASSYISAMDALMVAKDYAETKGLPFKISTMELRSCALSIFIAATKQGVR